MQKNKAQIFSRLCSLNRNCSSLYLSLLPACPGSARGHGGCSWPAREGGPGLWPASTQLPADRGPGPGRWGPALFLISVSNLCTPRLPASLEELHRQMLLFFGRERNF